MKIYQQFSLRRNISGLLVILFVLTFNGFQCNKISETSIDDGGGTMFMEEVGESEIIPIETDELESEDDSEELHELTRHTRDTIEAQKLSSPKTNLGTIWGSEEEGSADGDDEEDDYYDLDKRLEGTMTVETEDNSNLLSTPIMPTRVVPTLKSPLFGEGETEIEGTKTFPEPSDENNIQPTDPINQSFPSFKSQHYDEIEGSGYDGPSSIVPTRATGSPTRPPSPDHSPTFNLPGITPYDGSEGVEDITDRIVNRVPYIQKKIKRYPVIAGRSVRILIPEDTFFDMEDGNTRNLKLDLRFENGSAIRNTWLRFDAKKQAIYALPANEDDVGRWKFRLFASDKEGEKVSDILEIVVRQYSRSRLVNHQFNIEFSFTDWDPQATRHWEWMLLDKVQRLYGDKKPNNIIVRTVQSNPYVFGWTNNSLLDNQNCPKEQIRDLFNQLISERDQTKSYQRWGNPSQRLSSLLEGKAYVKNVTMTYHGTCLYDNEPNVRVTPDFPSNNNEDTVPKMRNPIDRINVTAGELLRFKVPEDTCYDEEDGGTEKLSLSLLTTNRRELSPDAWLQFDSRNQEFVGIPLEEEVGRTEYQLVCSDRNGLSAIDGIEVIVLNRPFSEQYSIEFVMQFDDYQGFKRRKVEIVEKIANFFGDSDPTNVVVNAFDLDENRIGWYNKSLAHLPCDHDALQWSRDMLLEKDGKFKKKLEQLFAPYLRLVNVEVIKRDNCAIEAVPTPTRPSDKSGGGINSFFPGIPADYLLTFIIPAVIIICMLILAILLACVLHKKRKAGKLNLFYSESLPPRVPVILQDELYDENQDHLGMNGNGMYKQPVLLPEDHFNNHSQNSSNNRLNHQAPEMDRLLQRQQAPVSIDPFSRGSLSRPTPQYQRRQM